MDALGVRMDSVPTGRTEWPLITAGTSVSQKAEGTAADAAVAATFSTETLKPKHLTGRFEYTHEQAVSDYVDGFYAGTRWGLPASATNTTTLPCPCCPRATNAAYPHRGWRL